MAALAVTDNRWKTIFVAAEPILAAVGDACKRGILESNKRVGRIELP
jgi:hypothetical protein